MPQQKSPVAARSTRRRTGAAINRAPSAPQKLSHARAKARVRAQRPWHKRLLLHPMAIFALLICGAFLGGVTYKAVASDYTVTAVVAAPPLSRGATITNPGNGAKVKTKSSAIVISGTCPDEGYVKLFRNGVFSGAAICNQGNFHISTSLFIGHNDLLAQDYTITDQAGPVSSLFQVEYEPPGAAQNILPPVSGVAPPLLISDYHFNVATTAQDFKWQLQFRSGQAPFVTHIDWGDKSSSTMNVANNDAFTISHHYKKADYYTIQVTAADAREQTADLQLVALIRKPGDAPIRGAILSAGNQPGSSGLAARLHWLVYIWPTYLVVAAMVASFALGERREYLLLRARAAVPKAPRQRLRHS